MFVFGTRPEAIKLAPVIHAARRPGSGFAAEIVSTGQHRELLAPMLRWWDLRPDHHLRLMRPGQTLAGVASRAGAGLDRVLDQAEPDMVIVQGDTTTAFAAGLAAFYRKIPVAHVEAGLRTHDLGQPFPEEANRRLLAASAAWHFAATALGRDNLLREGVPGGRIFVTGNPVVDALRAVVSRLPRHPQETPPVLITAHRRESFGHGLEAICRAVGRLARAHPDMPFEFPVHPNPEVRRAVDRWLARGLPNLRLLQPLPYPEFIRRLAGARLVLTDSGGIQEEAPALGVAALVMRRVTERPEALAAGCRLVPPEEDAIVRAAERMLRPPRAGILERPACPFGDGKAAERILAALGWIFGHSRKKPKAFVYKARGIV